MTFVMSLESCEIQLVWEVSVLGFADGSIVITCYEYEHVVRTTPWGHLGYTVEPLNKGHMEPASLYQHYRRVYF